MPKLPSLSEVKGSDQLQKGLYKVTIGNDPADGEIELSGDPSEFVLTQPEIGDDTEDGTMKTEFEVSPDDRYAYCEVYGYGTDGGEVHRDYSFIGGSVSVFNR